MTPEDLASVECGTCAVFVTLEQQPCGCSPEPVFCEQHAPDHWYLAHSVPERAARHRAANGRGWVS